MIDASSQKRRPGPPPAVMQQIRKRLSEEEVQGLQALFALRGAAQQVDNALSDWMADTVGSFARYQILMALWASKGAGIAHKDIVAAMGVTRATVSGLMAALERDGLVTSQTGSDDRRTLIAQLTAKGEAAVKKAFERSRARFRSVFASLSPAELATLTDLLHRVRDAFTPR